MKYFKWKGSFRATFGYNENGKIGSPDYMIEYINDYGDNKYLYADILGRLILHDNDKDYLIAHENNYVVYIESRKIFSAVSPKFLEFLKEFDIN